MKRNKTANKTLEETIMELYLNVKIRKQEEIENYDDSFLEREKENLRKASPFTIIEYIRSSIEILIDLKVQEKLQEIEIKRSEENFQFDDDVNEYEKLLRKLENDIRTYIKIEHQLKLHSENLQQKVEELEKQKEDYKTKYRECQEQYRRIKTKDLNNNEDEMRDYKKEIAQLQQIVKTYEEHNLKIPELEKKLRSQKNKYEKEMKSLEENYKEKLKSNNQNIKQNNNPPNNLQSNGSNIMHHNKLNINSATYEEDLDRVNYNKSNNNSQISNSYYSNKRDKNVNLTQLNTNNQHNRRNSRNSTTPIRDKSNDRSRTHSPDKDKLNPSHTARHPNYPNKSQERKKEIDYISSKINQYKKVIDNKTSENIKYIVEELRNNKELTLGNKSVIDNERTLDTIKLKTQSDLSDTINTNSKTREKINHSSHSNRGHSGDRTIDKTNVRPNVSHNKSNISQSNNSSSKNKTIHALKDNLTQRVKSNHGAITHIPSSIKESNYNSHTPNSNFKNKVAQSNANSNNSNIILSQHGVPCYNNIHIYTSGVNGIPISSTGNNSGKTKDLNLRQYIFNKAGKKPDVKAGHNKSGSSVHGHVRSNSTIGN